VKKKQGIGLYGLFLFWYGEKRHQEKKGDAPHLHILFFCLDSHRQYVFHDTEIGMWAALDGESYHIANDFKIAPLADSALFIGDQNDFEYPFHGARPSPHISVGGHHTIQSNLRHRFPQQTFENTSARLLYTKKGMADIPTTPTETHFEPPALSVGWIRHSEPPTFFYYYYISLERTTNNK
jgi:hypothetical protein